MPVARGRHMGLDVGDRRIGVALSDETATLASALTTLTRGGGSKDAAAVAELARRHGAASIVVGLPLNMNGTRGPQAAKVLAFVKGLERRLDVPVVLRDERLTTVEADERLRAAGLGWKERKRMVDQVAAVVILQEYLDQEPAREPAAKAGA
ncbi:MAG TPA: Holliday junction resolvase RuvX [Vicinamibacteria bacterium]|nr:Holliday junction resolvase RuvX [Vicinamibacteria bacterium]